MASLAATYHQQGRSKEGEELKVQVLELRKDVLGERYPATLDSMASLAATHHNHIGSFVPWDALVGWHPS
ncbi:MAG: Kinesin light chain [Thelocarpon impressellum]|nr:MAG: Kinesin light chain [Thelocarpon impressellum]